MSTQLRALADHYSTLQGNWHVSDRSGDYSRLVVPNGNSNEPFHRWFHMKEAFSHGLLARVVKDAGMQQAGCDLLDPFAGGGTSLLSALDLWSSPESTMHLTGIERNPLLWLVASTKVEAKLAGWSIHDQVLGAADAVIAQAKLKSSYEAPATPSATLNNRAYYSAEAVSQLYRTKDVIDNLSVAPQIKNVLLLALASAVEPSGKLRRDGRALRFEPKRIPIEPLVAFAARCRLIVEDLKNSPPLTSSALVDLGDGRRPDMSIDSSASVDLAIFSPPYPNNIDYTEVYKAESWILGCYDTVEDMKSQRLSTVRSHPSVNFGDDYWYQQGQYRARVDELVAPLLSAIPLDRYRHGRYRLVLGYVDDMLQVLERCAPLVRKSGRLVFVVGNSAHGSGDQRFVIAADVLIAALAEFVGWQVEEVRVSRKLSRKATSGALSRESVVSLVPPGGQHE